MTHISALKVKIQKFAYQLKPTGTEYCQVPAWLGKCTLAVAVQPFSLPKAYRNLNFKNMILPPVFS